MQVIGVAIVLLLVALLFFSIGRQSQISTPSVQVAGRPPVPASATPPPFQPNRNTQAVRAYLTAALVLLDGVEDSINALERTTAEGRQNIAMFQNPEYKNSWAVKAALSCTVIKNFGKTTFEITDVPPECYDMHRLLVSIGRKSVVFAEIFVGDVLFILTQGSQQVANDAMELRAEIQRFRQYAGRQVTQ
jgi:hypothetical protein